MGATARSVESPADESLGNSSPQTRQRLNEVLRRNLGFVWRCLRRLGVAAGDADDAAQQVFLVLASRLGGIELGRERAFLFRTAVGVAANARRKAARVLEDQCDTIEQLCSRTGDPESLLERRRARALLDGLLEELSVEQREAFVLLDLEELTKTEAAAVLNIPEGTVASRVRRARAHLARRLEKLSLERNGGAP